MHCICMTQNESFKKPNFHCEKLSVSFKNRMSEFENKEFILKTVYLWINTFFLMLRQRAAFQGFQGSSSSQSSSLLLSVVSSKKQWKRPQILPYPLIHKNLLCKSFKRVCKSEQVCACLCKSVHVCASLCKSVQVCASMCKYVKYVQVCASLRKSQQLPCR